MTEQDQILLDDFKAKLRLFIKRHDSLKNENHELAEQVKFLQEELIRLKSENDGLVKKYDNLKVAKVLSGNGSDKQQMKQRINKIVREIDKCIAQLNV